MRNNCHGTTRNGSPCKSRPMHGDHYCYNHAPERTYDPDQPPYGQTRHACDWDTAPCVEGGWVDRDAYAAANLLRCPCGEERLFLLDRVWVFDWCAGQQKEADR